MSKLVMMALVAMAVVRCGGHDDEDRIARCTAGCEAQGSCSSTVVPTDQCASVCATNQTTTTTAGCDSDYEAILDCTEGLADKCETTVTCGSNGPGVAWQSCIQRYCATHQTDTICSGS